MKNAMMKTGVFLAGFAPFQPMWGLGHILMKVAS